MADAPPPRPPPHGQNPRPPGAMPDGNYDIFIIPPHSAGSGFLYLPSLQPHRNSFLAGVACALLAVGIYIIAVPVLKQWISTIMAGGGGIGVLFLIAAIGVGGWALGKTQGESSNSNPNQGSGSGNTAPPPNSTHVPPPQSDGPPPNYGASPSPPRPESKAPPPNGTQSTWEKAREETKRREEERKRAEELRKKREEMAKAKEEAERAAKAKAEKEKWEQARAREKDQREREARERIARERAAREKELKDKVAAATAAAAEKARSAPSRTSPNKPGAASGYEKPTARSYAGTEDEFSYRPYGPQHHKRPQYKSSASSIISGLSEGSYAPSNGTSRTTPPPASQRGPYTTSDPDKIQIKAVYLFSDSFPLKPTASLVAGMAPVTDGLVLRITTEGLFIDDDVRHVPQRDWDMKAWTLKLVEDGLYRGTAGSGQGTLHVLRTSSRDVENRKHVFVLDEAEAWKVAIGLQRLKKGSQVRSLAMHGMKDHEVKGLLVQLGFV